MVKDIIHVIYYLLQLKSETAVHTHIIMSFMAHCTFVQPRQSSRLGNGMVNESCDTRWSIGR